MSFTLSVVWPDFFPNWLEIHVPRCATRGQYRLSHYLHDFNAAWQSERDTDWPASLHLSVFVSLHVIHLSLLKSMHSSKSAVDSEDAEDTWQYCCLVTEIEQKLKLGWCSCCHSDGKLKSPVSKGLNWVPALNTRRCMDNHRDWNWEKKKTGEMMSIWVVKGLEHNSELRRPIWTTLP